MPPTRRKIARALLGIAASLLACVSPAVAGGDAPQWMHALVNAPLPAHDDKTDAVLLYSEKTVTVLSADRIRKTVRVAYRILRPGGRDYGVVAVSFNPHQKIASLHGWCIPAQGKDYEVKDKDALEASLPKVEGSELVSDVKVKLLRIPAPDPGNIIGYEYEKEEQPLVLQDIWNFQSESPVRESHYSLQLPPGWEYKASWLNYPGNQARVAGKQSVAVGGQRREGHSQGRRNAADGGRCGPDDRLVLSSGRCRCERIRQLAADGELVPESHQRPARRISRHKTESGRADRVGHAPGQNDGRRAVRAA